MNGFDEWLEAPEVARQQREADFERFCETNKLDPEADESWDVFEQALAGREALAIADAEDQFKTKILKYAKLRGWRVVHAAQSWREGEEIQP